jgi:transposase
VPAVKRWLVRNPRFHLHFTPTYSPSWKNLVERWFAALTDRALRRAAHRSVKRPDEAIKLYIEVNNESPKPLVWTKNADEILASIARFCKRTSGAGH